MKLGWRFLAVSGVSLALTACMQSIELFDSSSTAPTLVKGTPRNIIMVVADGMGPAVTTGYRLYRDDPNTPQIEPVVFDDILVGHASTAPAPVSGYVTDSAASATSLAAGVKTYNGAIGLDVNKQPVKSVMHYAREKGMRTGVAVTSQINHATPAAYMVHNESRNNYDAIADSIFDYRINGSFVADVMLGGGTKYFERQDRDIVAQFIDAGYAYADSYNSLATVPSGSNVLGLFAPVGLPAVLDDKRQNRLAYLTEHAIKHLENPQGFFLLVEASQVDWAGHSNDIASVMAEMHDLDLTIRYLRDYVKQYPDTLVVLTADHATGGLTIGANGDYRWSPEYLRNMQASVSTIAENMTKQDNMVTWVATMLGFDLSDEEKAVIQDLTTADKKAREKGLRQLLDQRSNTGWTTSGHTGEDVGVYAFGTGADAFAGQIDNTDIALRMIDMVQKRATPKTVMEALPSPKKDSWEKDCGLSENWHCD